MPPQNQPTPPGDAFYSRAGAGHSTRLFIILIIALVVIAGAAWYLLGHGHKGLLGSTVTFVAAHSAASYNVSGHTLSLSEKNIQKIGPVTAVDGTQYMAVLATSSLPAREAGEPPPVVIEPPAPDWMLYRGTTMSASSSLGAGRPIGTMSDKTVLAITEKGLIALVPGGSVTIMPASKDLVGAANGDGTIIALKNDTSRTTDIYAITPLSFQETYLGSVGVDPLAMAFGNDGTLYVLTASSSVSVYAVSATAAPVLAATTTIPNNWP